MGGWLTGVIFFLIELYVLKHTYVYKYQRHEEYGCRPKYVLSNTCTKLPMRLWRWIVLIIANINPATSVLYAVFFLIWYVKRALTPEEDHDCIIWKLKFDKISCVVFNKVYEFLNKEL